MAQATATLLARAEKHCELCQSESGLQAFSVAPHTTTDDEHAIITCDTCGPLLESGDFNVPHWFCLQESAWSQVPPVQVVCWRALAQIDADWARDLKDQLYLADDVLDWAKVGLVEGSATVDVNGAPLAEGDAITLIKDLPVKGAGFTAKRGTMVRNIHMTDEVGIIEGKINKIGVVLKTCFVKKA